MDDATRAEFERLMAEAAAAKTEAAAAKTEAAAAKTEAAAAKTEAAEAATQRTRDAATIVALAAELTALKPVDPAASPVSAAAAAPSPRTHVGVAAVLAAHALVVVPSPSKVPADKSILATLGQFDFSATPLSACLQPLAVARSLALWHKLTADEVLDEEQGYPRATASVPPWIYARTRKVVVKSAAGPGAPDAARGPPEDNTPGFFAASTLYLSPFDELLTKAMKAAETPVVPGASIPWTCKPELLTTVRAPFHPAFTGEVKPAHSSGDGKARAHLFDEIVTYAMLGMLGSFFRGVPRRAHRFFRAPPYAFALAAFPHVGYLVAIEWAGKLLTSVVSEPFFVGSDAHAAAVARLPDCDFSKDFFDIPVDAVRVAAWPDDGRRAAVIWRVEAPKAGDEHADFFKILRGAAFDADFFRRVFSVYARYAAALVDAADGVAPRPPALLDAVLLFGAGEVCVRMPWAHGRDASVADLAAGGVAVKPVAEAVVWLARRGLLYVDLREPNVRVNVETGAVALVDYDDMALLAAPPASADELRAALQDANAVWAGRADVPGARVAVVDALAVAWGT